MLDAKPCPSESHFFQRFGRAQENVFFLASTLGDKPTRPVSRIGYVQDSTPEPTTSFSTRQYSHRGFSGSAVRNETVLR
jgi:hypothetical protein